MTDQATAPEAAPAAPESFDSSEDAARFLISARSRKAPETAEGAPADESDPPAEGADEPATAEHELSGEDNADPEATQAPGEDEAADPAEQDQPPIARPKSWAKEDQAEWDDLPRSLQDKIAAREDARDKAIRKGQNEVAEKLKGITAKEQATEQARQQYESGARDALKVLEDQQRQFFPDIRSMDDLEALAQEAHRVSVTDPFRSGQITAYLKAFDVHQQKLAVQVNAVKAADERASRDSQARRTAYATAQDAKLKELVPDYADAKKLAAARDAAMPLLDEYGLSNDQLQKWAASDVGFEILQHAGFQKIISDLMTARDASARLKTVAQTAAKKSVPPVQRPGTRQPAGQANAERIQVLTQRLNDSGSIEDATALYLARQNRRRPN